jgi:methionyl-tRNA synthetase
MGATLLAPFMPETADKIAAQLGMKLRDFDQLGTFGLYSGETTHVVEAPEVLFARLDEKVILEKAAAIQAKQKEDFLAQQEVARQNLVKAGRLSPEEAEAQRQAQQGSAAPAAKAEEKVPEVEAKPVISYDDFAKCQFLVGEILECKEVPKSKKLLCSQVKIGNEVRQILSGIKQFYSPEDMVGKKVMVLTNLAPREMAGLKSEGMLLCAEDADGNLALMTPEKPMPAGSEIC